MSAEPAALEDLARSVADGTEIDWAQAESALPEDARPLVRHLRLVAGVAALYRSLPAEEGEAQPLDVEAPVGPRWGHLVLLERIGQGTSAEVHRAWDLELQREVALKLFPPGDASDAAHQRVLGEARRLARVRHPNVAVVHGANRHDGRVGFWMELVPGPSLEELAQRSGVFDAREAARVGADLCRALAAVHGAGLLHRDIKAQNVLREPDGRVVLADFGTGERLGDTPVPRLAGTPLYLAPEILAGQAATVRSDLYSLGVLLFYLVTGEFPVSARTLPDLRRAHREGSLRRLRQLRRNLPERFVEAVERALSADPAARHASAEAMAADLDAALEDGSRRDRTFRTPWITRASMLAAAAVLVALAVLFVRSDTHAPPPRAAVAESVRSIAVLPLADLSGGLVPPYLAEALSDELISTLGQVSALRITPRQSVLHFQQTGRPLGEMGRALGVDAYVDGSVSVGGEPGAGQRRVRVAARLIAAGGAQLWSGSFERPLGDTLALQADLARAIARQVRAAVLPREAAHLARAPTTAPAAEDAYLRGRYHLGLSGAEAARHARDAFTRALAIDPAHAAAHAGLARCYVSLGFFGAMTQPEARARALAMAARALELDPELAEAHAVDADIRFYYDWDWEKAARSYAKALELNPSSAYARSQYARFLAAAGRLPEALAESARLAALDALSAEAAQTRGLILYYARDFRGAADVLRRAVALDPVRARFILGRVLDAEGRYGEAVRETELAIQGAREAPAGWHVQLARLHALAGDEARARAIVRQMDRGALRPGPEHLAYFYLALGDRPRALAALEQAVALRDPSVLWLGVDPRFDALRQDPRFEALIERLGVS